MPATSRARSSSSRARAIPSAIPSEAARIVETLKKKQGQVVEEVLLPDAAHGLVLRADRERVYQAIGDFLDKNLKPAASR